MYSLTETTRRLHIGKRKLYQLLESEGITPTLKSGHKLLTEDDFQHISKILQHGPDLAQGTTQTSSDSAHNTAQHSSNTGNDTAQHRSEPTHDTPPILLDRMTSEIEHLRQLLANEQEERRAERRERENYQQMVMVLQSDLKQTKQELLEAPRQNDYVENSPKGEEKSTVDFMDVMPEPDHLPVSSINWGSKLIAPIGMSVLVACAALFWFATAHDQSFNWMPVMQERVSDVLPIDG